MLLTTGIWNPRPLKDLESSKRNPESMTVFDSLALVDIYKRDAGT